MIINSEGFTVYNRLDYLQMAYFYAELILCALYASDDEYVSQTYMRRMILNAQLATI